MAFTGTATVVQVSDSIVRITGLSLAAGASGTIGLTGATGTTPGVTLPASFQPKNYVHQGVTVALSDMLDVTSKPATSLGDFLPVIVAKSGTTVADWRATLTNSFASGSPGQEIYIKLHE